MPKAILEFDLNDHDDRDAHKTAIKGQNYKTALWEVGQQVFRPARKHGYQDEKIREAIEAVGEEKASELIGLLESKFYEILNENDANDE